MEIFHYSDYRTFLRDHFGRVKGKNPQFSYEAWARRLGLKNNSSLLKVLNGQREAGPKITQALCEDLALNPKEQHYFEDLVRLSKAKKDPETWASLAKRVAQEVRGSKVRILGHQEFETISNWWSYAIRKLTRTRGFHNDPRWIQNRLAQTVPLAEVRRAVRNLLDLGLLEKQGQGLRPTQATMDTSDDVASEGLKRFHEGVLDLARTSLRSVDPKAREISGCTLGINPKDLPKAKAMIRKFEDEFSQLLEATPSQEVYQLEICFFPMTKGTKNEN